MPREGGAVGRGAGVSGWLWTGGSILIFRGTGGQGQGWQRKLTTSEGESWGGVIRLGPQLTVRQGLGSPAESEGWGVRVVHKERAPFTTSGHSRG